MQSLELLERLVFVAIGSASIKGGQSVGIQKLIVRNAILQTVGTTGSGTGSNELSNPLPYLSLLVLTVLR